MKNLLLVMVSLLIAGFSAKAQPTLSLSSVTGCLPGDTVLVHVLTHNFNGIGYAASFSCTIAYNNTNLTYLGAKNTDSAFSNANVNLLTNASQNLIMVSWFTATDTIQYPEGQIFDLQFIFHAGPTALIWDTNCATNLSYNNGSVAGPVAYSTYSMIDVNKKWVNSDGTYGTGGPPPYFMHSNICRFDTNGPVINNYKYAKLMYSTDSTESQWTVYGYARETSSGKLIFVSSLTDTTQKLLYDFGAAVGDTLKIVRLPYNFTTDFVVYFVDSVFFAGKMRKSINDDWFSGLGSIRGLLSSFSPVVGWAYYLSCYFEDGSLMYHQESFPEAPCFFEVMGIADNIPGQNKAVSIIPNPLTGIARIQLSEAIKNDAGSRFALYNLMGECVSIIQLHECTTLTKGNLANGLYFYNVVNSAGGLIGSGKLVIK